MSDLTIILVVTVVTGVIFFLIWTITAYSFGKMMAKENYEPIGYISSNDNWSFFAQMIPIFWEKAKQLAIEQGESLENVDSINFKVKFYKDEKWGVKESAEHRVSVTNQHIVFYPPLPLERIESYLTNDKKITLEGVDHFPEW